MSCKINECCIDTCLRKINNSKLCNAIGNDTVKPNDLECPLFCDKFFCYETGKIITDHKDKYWINDDVISKEYRMVFRLENVDVKFSGLSMEGYELQKYKHKHSNTENIVCPYCNYEIDEVWDYIDSSYSDYENIDCPECEKEFEVSIHREVRFTTNKIG